MEKWAKNVKKVWIANKLFRKINIQGSANKMTYQFFAISTVQSETHNNKYWKALGEKSTHILMHA